MLIDTHCHLNDKKFEGVEKIIERAKSAGVIKIIVPGTNLLDSRKAVELSKKYQEIYALVGIHPQHVREVSNFDFQILELKKLIKSSKKIVGVGEIGLDFYRQENKKEQICLFKKQLDLALEMSLPVVIHNRLADEEMLRIFEGMPKMPAGQFHCFSGRDSFLNYVLGRGFYVSFAGNVTYKDANKLCDLLMSVPRNRLLLESDSPYLAPEPARGSQNEPKNVKIIAEFQARLLGLSPKAYIAEVYRNTLCLFSGI